MCSAWGGVGMTSDCEQAKLIWRTKEMGRSPELLNVACLQKTARTSDLFLYKFLVEGREITIGEHSNPLPPPLCGEKPI